MTLHPPEPARSFLPRPFRRTLAGLGRHWFAGSAVATHTINAVNLLFPAGERFFIRSVRRYESRIEDAELRRQIRAFYAQEGRHANAHERYFDEMRAQGLEIDGVLRFIEWLLHDFAQKATPPVLQLSVTVALEHYTAIMAELPYQHPYLQRIEPAMLDLLRWHAAEEIEHKAVAFDVLRAVNPSYAVRMGGFVLATVFLVPIWTAVTAMLLAQDGVEARRAGRELRELLGERILGHEVFGRALREYLAVDFHPLDRDSYAMVKDFLDAFEATLEPRRRAS